jgi:hypothetical protein
MEPVTPPLVEQPTAAPTRKWTNARIAEVLTAAVAIGAYFGFDLDIDIEAFSIALGVLIPVAGGVVGYFTKNRAPG